MWDSGQRFAGRLGLCAAILMASGCHYGTECCIDQRLAQLNAMPLDLSAAGGSVTGLPISAEGSVSTPPTGPGLTRSAPTGAKDVEPLPPPVGPESSAQRSPFSVPNDLPGADAPPLRVPRFDPDQPLPERRAQVASLFDALPTLPLEVVFSQEAVAGALTLSDLQQTALSSSPMLREATAAVDVARGEAIQAGLWPNPVVGYQSDTVNTGGTSGYQGGFIGQTFITAGKLTLAQQAALMDVQAAEANLRRTQITLASEVRRGYFAVIIAQQRIQYMRALAQLCDESFRTQSELVVGGEAAAYELLQLRVFAIRARNALVVAENQHLASWRQLAATLGHPDMPCRLVRGATDVALPDIRYETALDYLLGHHTDLLIAQTQIDKAAYNLRLQRVTPIPDVDVRTAVQYDDTTPRGDTTYNLEVSVPLPVLNRNRGNIVAAEAELVRVRQAWGTTRNSLSASLADAYNRYLSNRQIATVMREQILRDNVRIYRAIYDRYRQAGESVDFAQIVIAQQELSQSIGEYLDALEDQWQAFVDLAELLQVDDLFQVEMIVEHGALPAVQP